MIEWLAKRLIRDSGNLDDPRVRRAYGALSGAVGIVLNLLLAAAKLLASRVAGSIAIAADAANNLSDAVTSGVTLAGFKLSGKRDDDEHPFGHGRAEYVAGLVVALLILLAGLSLGRESVAQILNPQPVLFHPAAAAVLCGAVALKLYMFAYNRRIGGRIRSVAMKAAALDSLSDAAATFAVLLSMLAERFLGWHIDGWAGALVSLLILRSGVQAAREAVGPLRGSPPSRDFVRRVEAIVRESDHVLGIHDLRVHDYGAGRVMISLHAEVPADGSLVELHDAVDAIERRLQDELNCEAVIHLDPRFPEDAPTAEAHRRILEALREDVDPRVTLHDFRVAQGKDGPELRFDVIVPRGLRQSDEALTARIAEIARGIDGRPVVVRVDRPFSSEDLG